MISKLELARKLLIVGHLDADDLRKADICGPSSVTFGEHQALPLMLAAGRAPGFGSQPIDERIRSFLDGAYGWRRWEKDRPPHPWERGGGDEQLDRLSAEEDAAIAESQGKQAEMWAAIDERGKLNRQIESGKQVSHETWRETDKAVETATGVWEKAMERERLARGAVSRRQSFLQEHALRLMAKRSMRTS